MDKEYPFEDIKAYYNQVWKTQEMVWDNNQKKIKLKKSEPYSGYVNVSAVGTDATVITLPSGYTFFLDTVVLMENAGNATTITIYNGSGAANTVVKVSLPANGFVTMTGLHLKRFTNDVIVQSSASANVDVTLGGLLEAD